MILQLNLDVRSPCKRSLPKYKNSSSQITNHYSRKLPDSSPVVSLGETRETRAGGQTRNERRATEGSARGDGKVEINVLSPRPRLSLSLIERRLGTSQESYRERQRPLLILHISMSLQTQIESCLLQFKFCPLHQKLSMVQYFALIGTLYVEIATGVHMI